MFTSHPQPRSRRLTFGWLGRWLFLLSLATFACGPAQQLLEQAAGSPGEDAVAASFGQSGLLADPEQVAKRAAEDTGMTLTVALNTSADDQRDRLLEFMGPPDTFRLTFQQLEGVDVRWEERAYYDLGARFDFVDGQLLWTAELEPPPDVALYAHMVDPREFAADMSPAQAKALLGGQPLLEMDLAEGDIPGGLMLAADQLMLGFDQDRLVYSESFYLTPDTQP